MARLASLAIGFIMSKPRKSAPKKEPTVEATPIIERYRSRHTWKEFVALYVPADADKYPTMHREYLK
jgi:hypothetical protein